MKINTGIDLSMTVFLLFLMAYQITGQELHEWIGTGMLVLFLVLFLVHNILNIRWYGSLLKGKYRLMRIIQTVINFSVLIAMLCLGFSGIVMSRHVFAVLPIHGPMATARTMHLAASYWGFVLISIHLGLHWGMVIGRCRKLAEGKGWQRSMTWALRAAAILLAGYGLYLFVKRNIITYMFLRVQFVFFDFEQSAVTVFAEYITMMGFWVFISYYASKGIVKNR